MREKSDHKRGHKCKTVQSVAETCVRIAKTAGEFRHLALGNQEPNETCPGSYAEKRTPTEDFTRPALLFFL